MIERYRINLSVAVAIVGSARPSSLARTQANLVAGFINDDNPEGRAVLLALRHLYSSAVDGGTNQPFSLMPEAIEISPTRET